ncbi:MAG: gliding motility-associated ABC transporter ATP-binding subunit GldA [Bacteroidota bacterium]|nr:gliding motility-associated ABC transporter ATP-binding subunit GldA [Bacteroidota bacterium]
MSITVKNITKLFGEQKALDDVSFSIKTGEIVGFIGPNGAGKSTMMKILTGFIPQTSGEAFINNVNTIEDSIEIRKQIGYLPENNPLYTDMYVREYLQMVTNLYKPTSKGSSKSSSISEMISLVGLELEQHKKIGALSKGYRQRVGLAQALIHDPSVLILDEPTSGLDPNQIIEIRNFIKEIGKEKTILLSTHIMQEVEAICDRVIIINQGKIVADDSAKNIQEQAIESFQTIEVEFENQIKGKALNDIDGVISVKKIDAKHFLLQGQANRDIRSEIFQWAVQNNASIISLIKREKSMEEVFQELTK